MHTAYRLDQHLKGNGKSHEPEKQNAQRHTSYNFTPSAIYSNIFFLNLALDFLVLCSSMDYGSTHQAKIPTISSPRYNFYTILTSHSLYSRFQNIFP